jgi:hypothetical protein
MGARAPEVVVFASVGRVRTLVVAAMAAGVLAMPAVSGAAPGPVAPAYDPGLVRSYAQNNGHFPVDGLQISAPIVTNFTINGTDSSLRPGTTGNTIVLTGSAFTGTALFLWSGPQIAGVTNTNVSVDSPNQVTLTVDVAANAVGPYVLYAGEPLTEPAPTPEIIVQVYRGEGAFFPLVSPARVADSRNGTGGRSAPLGAAGTWRIPVAGQYGIPTTATAVSVNLTAIGGVNGGYLALYPAGGTVPGVSSVNFGGGAQVVPNHLIVPLGADGSLDLFNGSSDPVNALVDVDGYFSGTDATGGLLYLDTASRRAVDMRQTNTTIGAGETVSIPLGFASGTPFSAGYVLDANVTITNQSAAGYASVFSGAADSTTASTHNWVAPKQDTANRIAVRTGAGGTIKVTNGSAGTIQVIIDLFGYYEPYFGYRFSAAPPTRVVDTRSSAPLGANEGRIISASTWINPKPTYVVGNLTGNAPTSATYFQIYLGTTKPAVSNLNLAPAETRANGFIQYLPPSGQFTLSNAFGNTHAIIDISGVFNV